MTPLTASTTPRGSGHRPTYGCSRGHSRTSPDGNMHVTLFFKSRHSTSQAGLAPSADASKQTLLTLSPPCCAALECTAAVGVAVGAGADAQGGTHGSAAVLVNRMCCEDTCFCTLGVRSSLPRLATCCDISLASALLLLLPAAPLVDLLGCVLLL